MEADLRTRLVSAGTAAASRVAWGERPQGDALPAIVLLLVSPGRDYSHGGAVGLAEARVQIDCWAGSHLAAVTLARAALAAIEPAATLGATRFGQSFLDGARDFGPEDLAGGEQAFRRSLDVMVWHEPV